MRADIRRDLEVSPRLKEARHVEADGSDAAAGHGQEEVLDGDNPPLVAGKALHPAPEGAIDPHGRGHSTYCCARTVMVQLPSTFSVLNATTSLARYLMKVETVPLVLSG